MESVSRSADSAKSDPNDAESLRDDSNIPPRISSVFTPFLARTSTADAVSRAENLVVDPSRFASFERPPSCLVVGFKTASMPFILDSKSENLRTESAAKTSPAATPTAASPTDNLLSLLRDPLTALSSPLPRDFFILFSSRENPREAEPSAREVLSSAVIVTVALAFRFIIFLGSGLQESR